MPVHMVHFLSWPWQHYNEGQDTVLHTMCARALSTGKLKRDVTAKRDPSFVSLYNKICRCQYPLIIVF